ncbi:translation initiation factor IF-2, partial [Nonomuraea basaltis]
TPPARRAHTTPAAARRPDATARPRGRSGAAGHAVRHGGPPPPGARPALPAPAARPPPRPVASGGGSPGGGEADAAPARHPGQAEQAQGADPPVRRSQRRVHRRPRPARPGP